MTEAKFSSSFSLYLESVRVGHVVSSDGSSSEHVQLVSEMMRSLQKAGYSVYEGGLEEGQKIEEVTGYVVAKNDKGLILWCYKEPLEWKISGGVIYDRFFDKLPFDPHQAKVFPVSSAPTLSEAKQNGYLYPCKMRILAEKTGKLTDKGHPEFRFVDVVSAVSAKAPVEERAPAASADPEATKTAICEYIQQKVTNVEQLDTAIARAGQRKGQLSAEQWDYVVRTIRSKIAIMLATSDQPGGIEDVARKHIGILGAEVVNGVIDFVRTAASAVSAT